MIFICYINIYNYRNIWEYFHKIYLRQLPFALFIMTYFTKNISKIIYVSLFNHLKTNYSHKKFLKLPSHIKVCSISSAATQCFRNYAMKKLSFLVKYVFWGFVLSSYTALAICGLAFWSTSFAIFVSTFFFPSLQFFRRGFLDVNCPFFCIMHTVIKQKMNTCLEILVYLSPCSFSCVCIIMLCMYHKLQFLT